MVSAQCACLIVVGHVQPHQPPIAGLVQRIDAQQALCVLDGGVELALLFSHLDELFQRPHESLVQTLARLDDPLVVAVGQQVAGIGIDGSLQGSGAGSWLASPGGLLQRLLEGSHI